MAAYKPVEMSEVGNKGKTHYAKHAVKAIEALQSFKSLTGAPRLRAADAGGVVDSIAEYAKAEGEKGDPRIRFLDTVDRSGTNVFWTVEYGRVGRYEKTLGLTPDDDDAIAGKATSPMPYRCLLMLPKTGKQGVLAVEDVYRQSPAVILPNWLTRGSHHLSLSSSKSPEPPVWRLTANQFKDLEALRAMIENADTAFLRFTKKTISGASTPKKRRQLLLESRLETVADREAAWEWAKKYVGLAHDKGLTGNGIAQLGELVDPTVPGLQFTDAVIVVEDANGRKKIGADRRDEVFTYTISEDARPTDTEWQDVVKAKVDGCQTYLDVDLDL